MQQGSISSCFMDARAEICDERQGASVVAVPEHGIQSRIQFLIWSNNVFQYYYCACTEISSSDALQDGLIVPACTQSVTAFDAYMPPRLLGMC